MAYWEGFGGTTRILRQNAEKRTQSRNPWLLSCGMLVLQFCNQVSTLRRNLLHRRWRQHEDYMGAHPMRPTARILISHGRKVTWTEAELSSIISQELCNHRPELDVSLVAYIDRNIRPHITEELWSESRCLDIIQELSMSRSVNRLVAGSLCMRLPTFLVSFSARSPIWRTAVSICWKRDWLLVFGLVIAPER